MPFKTRAKIVGWILGAFLLCGAFVGIIGRVVNGPSETRDSLTPEQKLSITADCKDNPDALRCQ